MSLFDFLKPNPVVEAVRKRDSVTLEHIATMSDTSQARAMDAIKALATLEDERYIDVLIVWLRSNSWGKEKFKIEYARQALIDKSAKSVPALIEVMTGNNGWLCLTVAEVLVEIGTPEALESVEKDRPHLEEERRLMDARAESVRKMMVGALQRRLEELTPDICKAFKTGRCVVRGTDSGSCTWNPSDWQNCNVVIENKKFYGEW